MRKIDSVNRKSGKLFYPWCLRHVVKTKWDDRTHHRTVLKTASFGNRFHRFSGKLSTVIRQYPSPTRNEVNEYKLNHLYSTRTGHFVLMANWRRGLELFRCTWILGPSVDFEYAASARTGFCDVRTLLRIAKFGRLQSETSKKSTSLLNNVNHIKVESRVSMDRTASMRPLDESYSKVMNKP